MTVEASPKAEGPQRPSAPNDRTELDQSILVVREPLSYQHGDIVMRLGATLHDYVEAEGLGRVFAADTGFALAHTPDAVRAADVAFVSRARLPDPPPQGFAELAPDLAVQVVSSTDAESEVVATVSDWLRAGTKLVWVVDPTQGTARVHRADGSESLLHDSDLLDGEDVLPGFFWQMSSLLRRPHP